MTLKTRQKLKEAYDAEFLATIERAEKQIILARHGRRLLQLLDDSPVVPGEEQRAYPHGAQARQILNDAEDDLRDWQPELDDQHLAVSHSVEKSPIQLQSPTMSSIGGDQPTAPRQITAASDDGGEAVENTPTAKPQGTLQSVRERGVKGDGDAGVNGVVSVRVHCRVEDAEQEPQSPQQQHEGGMTLVSESPVSSVGGWRQHGNLLKLTQSGLAFCSM